MKKPTKKELREDDDRSLLLKLCFWEGRHANLRQSATFIPDHWNAGARKAANQAEVLCEAYRAEILRRMGGGK